MSTWEERMSQRAGERERLRLGPRYGDPGPMLPPEVCRECWGYRHVWLGNTWGMRHRGGPSHDCRHVCHEGEVWLASAV